MPIDKPETLADKIAKSSQVLSVEYDDVTKDLVVVFESTAASYTYRKFPADLWQHLQDAPSLGSFLARHVKGKFDSVKAELAPDLYAALVQKKQAARTAGA